MIDGTDWTFIRDENTVSWRTDSHDENPNGNAIRWATMYTFRFDASASPISDTSGFAEYFRPGVGDGVEFQIDRPGECLGNDCPGDLNGDRSVTVEDILAVLDSFNLNEQGDANGDGQTDVSDLLVVIAEFGNSC